MPRDKLNDCGAGDAEHQVGQRPAQRGDRRRRFPSSDVRGVKPAEGPKQRLVDIDSRRPRGQEMAQFMERHEHHKRRETDEFAGKRVIVLPVQREDEDQRQRKREMNAHPRARAVNSPIDGPGGGAKTPSTG